MKSSTFTAIDRQKQIYIGGLGGRKPLVPVHPEALAEQARRKMSKRAWAYITGGAGLERSMAYNRAAFAQWRIIPRMLRDVSVRDTSVSLFGHTLPAPFLLAPIGVLELAHQQADLAVARAAAKVGIPMIFSNQASVPMEACAQAMGASPRWFQLYWSKSDELVASLVRRAEQCGCTAIVVTLDTTMLGWRLRDLDLAYLPFLEGLGIAQYTSDPVFQKMVDRPLPSDEPSLKPPLTLTTLRKIWSLMWRYPGSFWRNLLTGHPLKAVRTFIQTYSRPSLQWEDLKRLREMTHLPIVLKGILHSDDARRAVDYGVNGIVVSNHGGRQVDGAIASLEALPGIVQAVDGRAVVLCDSGIRTGSDAYVALALGADAILIGRPYVYGLAIAGQAGVEEVLRNFLADFELTMGLAGCRRVTEIRRERLLSVR